MDNIITPLISAFVSAGISYYVTLYFKDRDYKNEYYKKIIENRLAAYKLVQGILADLANTTVDAEDRSTYFTLFSTTLASRVNGLELSLSKIEVKHLREDYKTYGFDLFRDDLVKSLNQRAWLSNETIEILETLRAIMTRIASRYSTRSAEIIRRAGNSYDFKIKLKEKDGFDSHELIPDEVLMQIGKESHSALIFHARKLQLSVYKDTVNLYRVDEFIKSKLANIKDPKNTPEVRSIYSVYNR